ncbi:MAG: CehA/McbA family metallohydrolase [Desulfatibacillaceae bacterium]
MLIDLHVHTSFSPCSGITPQQAVDAAVAAGLDGLCVTDHGTMGFASMLHRLVVPEGFLVGVGMEYATDEGDLLLFGIADPPPPAMDAGQVAGLVRKLGGAVILAHPDRISRPGNKSLAATGKVSGIEAVNGRNSSRENLSACLWARGHAVRAVGGSDAHEPLEVGVVATRFSSPIRSMDDLVAALKVGVCFPEAGSGRPCPGPDVCGLEERT